MKLKIITFIASLVFTCSVYSQDTITITVNSLTDTAKIRIKSKVNDKTKAWVLVINKKADLQFKLKTQNGNNDHITLPIAKEMKTFITLSGKLVLGEQSLPLDDKISFSILDIKDNKIKEFNTIFFLSSAKSVLVFKNNLNYKTGLPYYDALTLNDKTISSEMKIRILNYYAQHGSISNPSDLINDYKDNKFLSDYVKKIIASNQGAAAQGNIISSLSSISLSAAGGLDVTNIADGFAKFVVKRTKEELTAAFFQHFYDALSDPRFVDMQTLFPQTCRAFSVIGNEIYNYQAYLQTLRESFEDDLSNITTNLPSILDNHPDFFAAHPELEAAFKTGFYTAIQLRDNVHPGDILKDYPAEFLENINKNPKGAIQTLQLVSASLRDSSNSSTPYWVNASQLKKLTNDSSAFQIYLGLLYQQALQPPFDSIHFQTTTLIHVLQAARSYEEYRNYILRFGEKANKLNAVIKNYKKHKDSLAFEQYAAYFNASLDLLEYTAEAGKLTGINLPYLADTLKNYFDIARSASDMALDISRRNYGAAITDAAHIYDLLILKPKQKNTKSSLKINPASAPSEEGFHSIFKYGTFMATVVQAKSSDDVENAIETFALPAGSSRIKRETNFNVSLNSYVGLFAGSEKIKGVDAGYNFNTWGVTAPIGLAVTLGNMKCKPTRGGKSLSVFASLVDLGAITSFRFQNEDAEVIPTIQLKDIISPGIFLSFGFGRTPISINAGYQAGPRLRKVSESLADKAGSSYGRLSVSLCVDIPVLNFYTRSK